MAGEGDIVKEASPPPLLAYTASRQDQARGSKKKAGGKAGRGKDNAKAKPAPARKFKRQAEPVLFDDKARHEYLTGFRKRKQARIENSKQKAKERENEERRKARAEARKARKEQAAENVRMEKVAYGGDEDDSDEEENGGNQRPASPSAFDTEEHHTTVTVEAWDPSAEQEVPRQKPDARNPMLKEKYQLPPSSRRAAKKAKSEEKAAASNKSKRPADSLQLSRLMDAEEASLVVAEPTDWAKMTSGTGNKPNETGKKGKFYYESKVERAKAKAKIREDKAKFAEKQKEKRKFQNILRRGGSKAKALMRGDL